MKENPKICVYAICKNEEKFVDRWVNAIKDEADYIVVLDTGSTDNTVKKLKKYESIIVKQYDYNANGIEFRFDEARNDSMKLIPYDTDICVIFDFDQIPVKGWSFILRNAFKRGAKEVTGYIIDHDDNGKEVYRWISRNVHAYSPFYIWTKPIHEGIEYYGPDKDEDYYSHIYFEKDFIINHYPDNKKDRSIYKKLLEEAVNKNPKDPYFRIYLGIELSRRYSKEEACDEFKDSLYTCDFSNNEDLKFQMALNWATLACDLNRFEDGEMACKIAESCKGIKSRRLYNILANIFEKEKEYSKAVLALNKALEIKSFSGDWTDDEYLYNGYIEDRISLFYYYQIKNPYKALEYCVRAIELDKNNERLKNNLGFYYKAIIEGEK